MFTSELVSASDLPKIAALDYQILPNFQQIFDFQPTKIHQQLGFAWSEKGSLALGQFVPEQHGQILQVKSGREGTCCPKMVPFSVIIHICTPEDERRVHLRVRAHTPGSSESII